MERLITYENLRNFAYSNDHICEGQIKGIVVDFFGLGGQHMYSEDTYTAQQYAKHNILFVVYIDIISHINQYCKTKSDIK